MLGDKIGFGIRIGESVIQHVGEGRWPCIFLIAIQCSLYIIKVQTVRNDDRKDIAIITFKLDNWGKKRK